MGAQATAVPAWMTADEFLLWEAPDDGKYELESGVLVAMAPANIRHASAKGDVYLALRQAIRAGALDCAAWVDGPAVRIDHATSYVPDVVVQCGPRPPETANELREPVVVVEVLSPSTAYRDMGDKLAGYFRVASIQHYVIVDAERRRVIHHARATKGFISTRLLVEGELLLDPPGLILPISDLLPPAQT